MMAKSPDALKYERTLLNVNTIKPNGHKEHHGQPVHQPTQPWPMSGEDF